MGAAEKQQQSAICFLHRRYKLVMWVSVIYAMNIYCHDYYLFLNKADFHKHCIIYIHSHIPVYVFYYTLIACHHSAFGKRFSLDGIGNSIAKTNKSIISNWI